MYETYVVNQLCVIKINNAHYYPAVVQLKCIMSSEINATVSLCIFLYLFFLFFGFNKIIFFFCNGLLNEFTVVCNKLDKRHCA